MVKTYQKVCQTDKHELYKLVIRETAYQYPNHLNYCFIEKWLQQKNYKRIKLQRKPYNYIQIYRTVRNYQQQYDYFVAINKIEFNWLQFADKIEQFNKQYSYLRKQKHNFNRSQKNQVRKKYRKFYEYKNQN